MLHFLDSVASLATFSSRYSEIVHLRTSEAKTSFSLKTSSKSCKLSTPKNLRKSKISEKNYYNLNRAKQNLGHKLTWHRNSHRGSLVSFSLTRYLCIQKAWITTRFTRTTDSTSTTIAHSWEIPHFHRTKMKISYPALIRPLPYNKKSPILILRGEDSVRISKLSYRATASCASLKWRRKGSKRDPRACSWSIALTSTMLSRRSMISRETTRGYLRIN